MVLPVRRVREWRAFIAYRTTLVRRRTAIRKGIGATLDRHGLPKPTWTNTGMAELLTLARPLSDCAPDELWRGVLFQELASLGELQSRILAVEVKLDELARADGRVARLRTIPGVGLRLSETIVAVIDDPKRFTSGKQVGAYVGLVPRRFQSGTMDRNGRITGTGHTLLRTLLVEVAWLARRHNGWLRGVYDRACRGVKTRRKVAVVAAARRLLVLCWVCSATAANGANRRQRRPDAVTLASSPTKGIEAVRRRSETARVTFRAMSPGFRMGVPTAVEWARTVKDAAARIEG